MPGDLNLKKSWNPALMKNQKKVWEREQQALKELQTIKQRQKEIAQEREKEDMIRLQYGSDPSKIDSKVKLELNKLGWMYSEGPKESRENEAGFREVDEDFLANSGEVTQLLQGSKAIKSSAGSRFDQVASVGAASSAGKLNDDPLLMIRKEQLKKSRDTRDRSPSRHSRDKSSHRSSDRDDARRDRGHRHRSHRDRDHREREHREREHREREHREREHREREHREREHREREHREREHREREYRRRQQAQKSRRQES